jgi:predicted RNA methylase
MDTSTTRLANKLGRTRSEEGGRWVYRFENGLVVLTDPFMAKDRARVLPLGGPQDTLLNHLVCFPDKVRAKRVFDPFAGSGVLGLMALRLGAAYVDFLDVSARACEFQRENAARNGFATERFAAHLTSIEGFAPSLAYDVVLANPPFVPTPPGIDGTLTSAAGPLGNTQLDMLLAKLDAWLLPEGEAYIYVMQFVAESGPLVARTLNETLPGRTTAFTPTQAEPIALDVYCDAYRKYFPQAAQLIERWRSELIAAHGPLGIEHYVMHIGPKRAAPAQWTITRDLAEKYGTLPYPALANQDLARARVMENLLAP